ncbi:MAG TPA: diguanylate cyclase [Xanthobacteraceae bacterium]|jgi:diguanylate cyclase (GGDEF)-like protein|nr:diguanylate cyclase [Xanthobacteraceae bacterium]
MNLKIGARLVASFGAVFVLLTAVGVTVSVQMYRMNANTQHIINQLRLLNLAHEGQAGTYFTALYLYRAIAESTNEELYADLSRVEQQATRNTAIYRALQSMQSSDTDGRILVERMVSIRKQYYVALHPAHVQMANHGVEDAKATLLRATPLQMNLLNAQSDVIDYERAAMERAVAQSAAAYAMARAVLWGLTGFTLLIAVSVGLLVTRSIVKPMQAVMEGAKHAAYAANHDFLTGALSRRGFEAVAGPAFIQSDRESLPLSLLIFDVDHFKAINDTYGHAGGDRVLRQIVELMRRNLRPHDVLGRLGGEEFAIVLPCTTLGGAREIAERLRSEALKQQVSTDAGPCNYSISGGVALRLPGETLDQLMMRADRALYEAKSSGRNRVCFIDNPSS